MTTRTMLAVLGPALVISTVIQVLDTAGFSSSFPPFAQALLVALLASAATCLIAGGRNGHSVRNAITATGNKSNNNQNAGHKPDKSPSARKELGNVKWFNANKGFGFITRDNGEEIFVHFRSIVGGKSLRDGQRVEFAVTTSTKGLQAEDVVALK